MATVWEVLNDDGTGSTRWTTLGPDAVPTAETPGKTFERLQTTLNNQGVTLANQGFFQGQLQSFKLMDLDQQRGVRSNPNEPEAGFGSSMLWSAGPGFLGADPPEEIQKWRDANFGGSFFSQALGELPYWVAGGVGMGMLKGAGKMKKLWEGIDGIGSVFLQSAATEAALSAPTIIGRQLGAAGAEAAGYEGAFKESALRSLLDIGIGVPLGGAIGGIVKSRWAKETARQHRQNKERIWGAYHALLEMTGESGQPQEILEQSWQQVSRNANRAAQSMPENLDAQDLNRKIQETIETNIFGEPLKPKGTPKVRSLVYGGAQAAGRMARFFSPRPPSGRGGFYGRRMIANMPESDLRAAITDGFDDLDDMRLGQQIWRAAQSDRHGWQGHVSDLRDVKVTNAESVKRGLRDFTRVANDRGINVYWNQEIDNGFGTMALLVDPRRAEFMQAIDPAPPLLAAGMRHQTAKPRLFVFKTDKPEMWAPGLGSLHQEVRRTFRPIQDNLKWAIPELVSKDGTPELWELSRALEPLFDPAMNTQRIYEDTTAPARFLSRMMHKMGFGEFSDELGRNLRYQGREAKNITSPLTAEYRTGRARMAATAAETIYRRFEKTLIDYLDGEVEEAAGTYGKSLLRFVARRGANRKNSPRQALQQAFRTDPLQTLMAQRGNLTVKQARDAGFHPDVIRFVELSGKANEKFMNKAIRTYEAVSGNEWPYPLRDWHLGIMRTWVGDYRVPIFMSFGREARQNSKMVVGYGSGVSPQRARESAMQIIRYVNDNQINLNQEGKGGHIPLYDYSGVEKLEDYTFNTTSRESIKDTEMRNFLADVMTPEDEVAPGITGEVAPIFGGGAAKTGAKRRVSRVKDSDMMETMDIDFFARSLQDQRLSQTVVDLQAMLQAENYPKQFEIQKGALGYRGDPLSQYKTQYRELDAQLVRGAREVTSLLFRKVGAKVLSPVFNQVMQEAPDDGIKLGKRYASMIGHPTDTVASLNKTADLLIGSRVIPGLGPGSAKKLVTGWNKMLFPFTLGFGDIGYPIISMFHPIQSMPAELALIKFTPPERLAPFYSYAGRGGLDEVHTLNPIKALWRGTRLMADPDAYGTEFGTELKEAVQRALDERVVGPNFRDEAFGPNSMLARRVIKDGLGATLTDPTENSFTNVLNIMSTPAELAEEVTRGYSFTTAYDMFRNVLGMDADQAYIHSAEFVKRTMFGYATHDRPFLMQGAMGSGWGLFKNFAAHMLFNWGRYSREAAHGNFMPLLYGIGSMGVVGGAVAVPGFGVADGLSRFFTDKSAVQLTYDMLGGDDGEGGRDTILADGMLYGPLGAAGVALTGRVAAPGASLVRDLSLMANSVALDRGLMIAQNFGDGLDALSAGLNPLDSPKFRRSWLRAWTPRTFQRAWQVAEGDFVRSIATGNQLVGNLNKLEQLMFATAITPTKVQKRYEEQADHYRRATKMRAAMATLGDAMATARLNRDVDEIRSLTRTAIANNIPVESVRRSAETRMRNQMEPLAERQMNEIQDRVWRRSRGTL